MASGQGTARGRKQGHAQAHGPSSRGGGAIRAKAGHDRCFPRRPRAWRMVRRGARLAVKTADASANRRDALESRNGSRQGRRAKRVQVHRPSPLITSPRSGGFFVRLLSARCWTGAGLALAAPPLPGAVAPAAGQLCSGRRQSGPRNTQPIGLSPPRPAGWRQCCLLRPPSPTSQAPPVVQAAVVWRPWAAVGGRPCCVRPLRSS